MPVQQTMMTCSCFFNVDLHCLLRNPIISHLLAEEVNTAAVGRPANLWTSLVGVANHLAQQPQHFNAEDTLDVVRPDFVKLNPVTHAKLECQEQHDWADVLEAALALLVDCSPAAVKVSFAFTIRAKLYYGGDKQHIHST